MFVQVMDAAECAPGKSYHVHCRVASALSRGLINISAPLLSDESSGLASPPIYSAEIVLRAV